MFGGTLTATGSYRINCPFCAANIGKPDEHGHLYFDPNRVYKGVKGQFVCFRCGERGDYEKLRHFINAGPIYRSNIDNKLFNFKWNVEEKGTESDRHTTQPPTKPIEPGSLEEGYLFSRGFTRAHIDTYDLKAGCEHLFDRVVIPSYEGEVIRFWQARGMFKDIRPKYISPPSSNRGGTVFNLERASQYKKIYIKEGPLNAIMGGFDCVALFGKEASPLQVEAILRTGIREVVVCLDNDAFKWSLRLAKTFKNKDPHLKVSIFIPNVGEDTVDVGFLGFREMLKTRTFELNDVCSEEKIRMAYNEISEVIV